MLEYEPENPDSGPLTDTSDPRVQPALHYMCEALLVTLVANTCHFPPPHTDTLKVKRPTGYCRGILDEPEYEPLVDEFHAQILAGLNDFTQSQYSAKNKTF